MQTNLTTLQQTFAKQFGDLNVSAGQNTEELKSYLEELNNGLKQDMNQVFTSVSNGKKKLASALLTKGVSTNEDATFAQLAEAILNIDQKLVIGVEEIPGTIRYQYHYHVDVSGNQPHTEKSDTAGGCYTGTHGHVHSVEDGCYKEESYHVHRDDCSGYPVWVDWAPGVEPYWGFIYTCGEPANATRRVLICSKQAGSTDYYVPSCGLADGQIIGAEILYDQAHAQVKAQEEQQCFDGESGALAPRLSWFQRQCGSEQLALAMTGLANPDYRQLKLAAGAIARAWEESMPSQSPILILLERDMAKALGFAFQGQTHRPVLALDDSVVKEGDYIDLGQPVVENLAVPVVVKTLIFG